MRRGGAGRTHENDGTTPLILKTKAIALIKITEYTFWKRAIGPQRKERIRVGCSAGWLVSLLVCMVLEFHIGRSRTGRCNDDYKTQSSAKK